MGAVSAATILALTDKYAAYWNCFLGTDGSGLGLGTAGGTARAKSKVSGSGGLESIILGTNDIVQINFVGANLALLDNQTDAVNAISSYLTQPFADLDKLCRAAGLTGVTDLNSFLTYYNTGSGGPWACLVAPDFRVVYDAVKKSNLAVQNAYYEVLNGASFDGNTFTNALRKLVVSGAVQTAGFSIDSTQYAGGFGQVTTSGFTGSSDTVSVAGTWRKVDGTTATGNATATVAGNGTVVLTPPFTNALLLSVSSISVGAGITGGTIYAEAKRPAGRTNPPT